MLLATVPVTCLLYCELDPVARGMQICEWMRTQPEMRLLPGDHAVHLDLVAKVWGLPSAEKFFEDMPERANIATGVLSDL